MGSGSSSYAELPKNEHLNRLISKEVLGPSDPFWNSLLSTSIQAPSSKVDWREFDHYTEELKKRFLLSNLKTGNFVSLLKVVLLRTSELKNSVIDENSLFIWQTNNAIFIVRVMAKFMMEKIKEEDVVRQFNVVLPDEEELPEAMFPLFLRQLCELIVETPLAPPTYSLLTEATRLLTVLLSSPLFCPPGKPSHQLTPWKELMQGGASVMAVPLTSTLLIRFMERQPAPPSNQGGSLVLGLASGVWNLLTLGYGGGGGGGGKDGEEDGGAPLADISLTLLLLLVNHCTDTSAIQNPYSDALANFSNSADRGDPAAGALFQVEVPMLYSALAATLHTDEATLLLYLLLHKNKGFHNYVLAATDIDRLVIPILQSLYRAPSCSNHHIYMSLIILLILSEDDLFNETVHSCILRPAQVSWYTERGVSELSLGGLLILVVIRTIQYNMLKMRDKYLHTNCLAALANMSSQFRNLHPYAAQRIVSLFETLARKHGRLVEGLAGTVEEKEEEGFTEVSEAVQDAAVLEEVLRMVLEIVNSCLVHQTQHNPNLIYALLYKRELFEAAGLNPAFTDLAANLLEVVVHMGSRLEQVQERKGRTLTVEEVQEVVRQGAAQFPKERLNRLPDLKFKYVEEEEPEEFFIPYVWTLATERMHWSGETMRLFSN